MRGSLWGVVVAMVGGGTVLYAAVSNAAPTSPAASTQATESVLTQVGPLVGIVLALVAVGALLKLAF